MSNQHDRTCEAARALNMQQVKDKYWYLLQAKPRKHEKALKNLIAMQHECYSPNIVVKKLKNGVSRSFIEPLFPGYIFINLNMECNWGAISSTRGVNKFVRFGSYPTKIHDEFITKIERLLPKYEANLYDQNSFRKGDSVRIKGGSFMDFEAIFDCEVGSYRSAILITHLEKTNKFIVNTELLEKLV